jgi:hypothetical protein
MELNAAVRVTDNFVVQFEQGHFSNLTAFKRVWKLVEVPAVVL